MYQLGFSSTLRWMTDGVTVPKYPRPIIEVRTVFCSASAASSASASRSVAAAGIAEFSTSPMRIDVGTAAAMRASSES